MIDISRTISNQALVYPGEAPVELTTMCDIAGDCPCRITRLDGWTTHLLTHLDAPRHFIRNGRTLDEMPLARFVCAARVVQTDVEVIDGDFVRSQHFGRGEAALFRTRHSGPWTGEFDREHVHIAASGAEALIDAGVNLVGIDYLSVDKFGSTEYPAHRRLLSSETLVLEAADFSAARPGEYVLSALPLKIADADGSPVRAVLFDNAGLVQGLSAR